MEHEKASAAELRESVNPVFKTARSCVTVNALLGDADAQKLMGPLGFDISFLNQSEVKMTAEMREFAAQMANPGFNIMVETRFSATNKFILESGKSCVADLPCGYTPRGIKLADTGIDYFGLDIPAVADEIGPAVRKVIGKNEHIRYFAVDATNPGSLKKALSGAQGELLITTEGLLMYLTQSELDEVFQNMQTLLKDFGGQWVTTDNEILAAHYRLVAVLTGDNLSNESADQLSQSTAPANVFMKASTARDYAERMGFEVRKIPVFDFMPETLLSLKHIPEEKRNAVRGTFKKMFFWVMTVKKDLPEKTDPGEQPFSVWIYRDEDHLRLAVSGRLDTITAPELLSIYQNECAKGEIRSLTIDMSRMSYISSAGLRVFLIMRKSLADGRQFHIRNMNKTVQKIMKMTGFADLFGGDDE